MGGSSGGGSSAPVEQTVTQTQFPEEAKPYYTRLLSRGEAESLQPYAAYPSQRLAEFSPEEEESFQMTGNLARQGTPWAMQQAQQTAGELAQGVPSWAQQQAQQTASELARGIPSWAQQQAQGTASRISNALPWEYQQAQQTASDFARGTPFEPWTGFQQQRRPFDPFRGFGRQQFRPYQAGTAPWMQDPTFRGGLYNIPGAGGYFNQPPYISQPQTPMVPVPETGIPQPFPVEPPVEPPVTTPVEPPLPRPPIRLPVRPPVRPPRFGIGRPRWGEPEPMYGSPMQRYMSPYQQGVIDVQKEQAFRDANRMRSDIGLQAAQAGGLGGYREGIVESNLNRDLMRQIGDIQQTGQQAAYQNAQRMFEADRAAKLAAGQQQLAGAQQLGGLNLNLLQQQLAGAQQLGGLDLSNMQQRLASAQQLGAFAPTAQQMALSRIGALGGAGQARRGFQQAGMDIGYQDFLRQLGYPQQQLGFQSDVLRGLQLRPSETVSQYAQRPGLFQSALGSGLGALGLYKSTGGGG
jgi:hypothetical protein